MKDPNSKANKINIIFSSFLVIGYIICTYFFSSIANQIIGVWGSLLQILIMTLFGLLLFYATRVGEGKQIRRFSLAVLLLIDVPALYLILASLVKALPLHNFVAPETSLISLTGAAASSGPSVILMMACVALGYGIPYTFFAGYELKEEGEEIAEEEEAVLEGGLAEELAETEKDAETAEDAAEEAVEETGEEATEAVEEAAEETEEATEAVEDAAEEAEEAAEEATEEATEEAEEAAEESEKEAE